ncbi:MAG: hypothetical protein PHS62_03810 [Patescibacteria group bacterium]|nr:hypothetical protein [Patescibacteria group bacterium]
MKKRPGKFIVIYGINNIGKTTQAKLLVKKLKRLHRKTEYLKYPLYNLAPSGQILNDYLRQGNPNHLTPKEAQIIFALNRAQYQPVLEKKLARGVIMIAEDYVGTGLAWGLGTGPKKQFLKNINADLTKENLAFLLDGQRFLQAKEKGHKHEAYPELNKKVKAAYLKLAREYGWTKINAQQTRKKIHEQIWSKVTSAL